MRYYKLEIGSLSVGTPLTLSLISDTDNTQPLQISFNIKIYNTTATETNGSITIHNLPQSTYTSLSDKIRNSSCNIKLTAGWIDSPLASHHSLSSAVLTYTRGVLINAEASNIAADFSTNEPYVIIWFKAKNNTYINSAGQTYAKQIQINTSDVIATKLKTLLESLGLSKISVDSNIASKTYTGKQTLLIGGGSLEEVIENIRLQFGWGLRYLPSSNTAELADPSTKTLASSYTISYGDLLKQPEIVGPAQIAVTLRLTPGLYVGQAVTLTGTLPSGISALSGNSDYVDTSLDTNVIFATGLYQISAITHIGDFYNTDAEAWATQILLTRTSALDSLQPEDVKTIQSV